MPFLIDRRQTMLAAAAGFAGLAMPAFAQAQGSPRRGGTLRYAAGGLDTSDFHRHTGSISVPQVIVEAPTSIADDGGVKPFLAESWTISPNGTTYTFKIRPNVRFHNNRLMTSADFLANFERVKSKITGGWLASAMKQVAGFEAPDPSTFVIRMQKPYAPLLNLLSELWIVAPESAGWNETITLPLGTGPFKFEKWTPKAELLAPRHDAYWQEGKPYLDAIRFDLSDNDQTDVALRAGDLHIVTVSDDKLANIVKLPGYTVHPLKDSSWYFWSFNNRKPRPPFNNLKVRQAVSYALDKQAYMSFIAGDRGIVTNQMVAPGNFFFDKALHESDPHAKQDLAKAREILKAEGVNPASTPLRVVSWQNAYAEIAVQMVRELGFKVEHIALDDLGAQRRLGEYDWDLAPMGSGPRADVFLRYVRMMSDGPNPVLWGGVQDPEFDRLTLAGVAEVDNQKRRQFYVDAWKRAMDRYYTVVVGHAFQNFAARPEVKGFSGGFTYSPHRVDGGLAFTWLAPGA
ncbi:DdpA ABC-type dipeptide transport system, periplasmic component [Rhabdaerophilaceae bacterium]